MKSRKIGHSLVATAFVLGWTANFAKADDPPKDNKGFSTSKTTVVELGPDHTRLTLTFDVTSRLPGVARLFAGQVQSALRADHAFTLRYLAERLRAN